MTYQRLLLKVLLSGVFGRRGEDLARRRTWTVETGEAAGLKLELPQNRDYIFGSSELPVQEAFSRHIHPGGVVYDIGANMGFFSLIAARLVGPNGQVNAFEPVSENVRCIRENANLNRFANVQTYEVAVGNNAGAAELLLTNWDGGSTLNTSSVKPSEPVAKREVEVIAIDSFIGAKNLRSPTFIKIDVEGLELEVLRGMSEILKTVQPIILFEVDDGDRDTFHRRWRELDDYMESFGYLVTHLESSYGNRSWNVGHSVALPRSGAGK
jgi:FkbM family methyltransferase